MTTKNDMNTEVLRELAKREMAKAKQLHAYNAKLDAVLTAHPLRLRDVFATAPIKSKAHSKLNQPAPQAEAASRD